MPEYHAAKVLDSGRKIIVSDVPNDVSVGAKIVTQVEIGDVVAEYLGRFEHPAELEEKETFGFKRLAKDSDIRRWRENQEKLENILRDAKAYSISHGLPMSLFAGEIAINGKMVTLFFTAESRIDFRALVKYLQEKYNTKVRLWQVGVRDRAMMLGGIGICGRPLCCHNNIKVFDNVSIYMAKRQLNIFSPGRISGQCGRLMCCLRYEDHIYKEIEEKGFPRVGDVVVTTDGNVGKVATRNIFTNMVYLHFDDGTQGWIDLEDVAELKSKKSK